MPRAGRSWAGRATAPSPKPSPCRSNICTPSQHIFPFIEAAALPLAGLTAYRALVPRAQVQPGETVLVHGIGGGVALFVLQFARALGARVMVTSTDDDKLARARALGAEHAVRSRDGDWVAAARAWTGGRGVDVAVDSLGGDYFARSLHALRRGGRLVTFGTTVADQATIDLGCLFWSQLSLLGATMGSPADFAGLLQLVNDHQIRPVIDTVWPLAEGCRAFERMVQGRQFGKIVITCEAPEPADGG
jgi:NADPH:quinone reductase-like Zn-dependent oxidoreductase